MQRHLIKTAALLVLVAAFLPGCGGGEDSDGFAEATALEMESYEAPSRGPEWLRPPADASVADQV
ncbi:hypothetical protein [Pseudorhodoferax sp. Leaf267]|uniref:hypothetical protein n=1 Tax=Pseudorhodoferax sp. Leaf267 TaxID=1736316 RepID=UPI0006F78E99|nr:hypothetical protein [Pseudorhodoferax sp. Leaf267]KQP19992.1 hypothetical protein ASF43_27905 [Pseudorhodoferax sp. Leaf267]